MCDQSFAWAKAHPGHFRVNAIHGAEEAKLVISETFNVNNQSGSEMKSSFGFKADDTRVQNSTDPFSSLFQNNWATFQKSNFLSKKYMHAF